jgi:alpha-glucuronidase
LRGLVDDDRYQAVLKKLEYQAGHAIVWRDTVCNWFFHESGIPDAQGRVGHHPYRVEAEAMSLEGFVATDVSPWEDASGAKAITCPSPKCAASEKFSGKPGWYNLTVQYFDQNNGISHFEAFVNQQSVGAWSADQWLPTIKPDSNSSTRHTIPMLALRPGDEIRIVAVADGQERAAIDYIEITPN